MEKLLQSLGSQANRQNFAGAILRTPHPPNVERSGLWFQISSHTGKPLKPKRLPPRERHVETVFTQPSNLISKPSSIPACSDVSDPIETEIVILERDVCTENVEERGSKLPYNDHYYLQTHVDEGAQTLLDQHPDLKLYMSRSQKHEQESIELQKLNTKGQILKFDYVSRDEKLFSYYTGLKVNVFMALFNYLKPKASYMKYPYGARTVLFNHHASDENRYKKKPEKVRSTTFRKEEMFFTLVKLRLGLQTADCAIRFGVATSTFSSIFTAWVTLLSQELELICKMPDTTELYNNEQASCFEEFPNVRVIIDCTELFAETPSALSAHKQFHSNYKHHSTVKFLVGMNSGGAITYISDMYGGRASDKFITNESHDLLNSLNPGEKVMADRGLTIAKDLPVGVKLIIPSFKHKDKSQFSKTELKNNKNISEARVHIERAIRRIKQFQILKQEMKLTQIDIYCNIFKACAYLVNFQDPFLKVE